MKKYKKKIIKILKISAVCLAIVSVFIINTFALTIDGGDTTFNIKNSVYTYSGGSGSSVNIVPREENSSFTNGFELTVPVGYASDIQLYTYFESLVNAGVNGTLTVNFQLKNSSTVPSWAVNEGYVKLYNVDTGETLDLFNPITDGIRYGAEYKGPLPQNFGVLITFDSNSSSTTVLYYDITFTATYPAPDTSDLDLYEATQKELMDKGVGPILDASNDLNNLAALPTGDMLSGLSVISSFMGRIFDISEVYIVYRISLYLGLFGMIAGIFGGIYATIKNNRKGGGD